MHVYFDDDQMALGDAHRRLRHRHSSISEIKRSRTEEMAVLGEELDVTGMVGTNMSKSTVGLPVRGDLVGRSVVVVLLPLLRTGDLVRVVGGGVRCGLVGVLFGFGLTGLAVTGGRVEGRGLTVGGVETGGFVTKTHSGGTLSQ
jgi:hypothetical protein